MPAFEDLPNNIIDTIYDLFKTKRINQHQEIELTYKREGDQNIYALKIKTKSDRVVKQNGDNKWGFRLKHNLRRRGGGDWAFMSKDDVDLLKEEGAHLDLIDHEVERESDEWSKTEEAITSAIGVQCAKITIQFDQGIEVVYVGDTSASYNNPRNEGVVLLTFDPNESSMEEAIKYKKLNVNHRLFNHIAQQCCEGATNFFSDQQLLLEASNGDIYYPPVHDREYQEALAEGSDERWKNFRHSVVVDEAHLTLKAKGLDGKLL